MRYLKYKCGVCQGTFIADRKTRWTMVSCEKGCSKVDAEEDYIRYIDNTPTLIRQSDNLKELKQD